MLTKIKNLFNVKAWFESMFGKLILNKGVKHAVSVIMGLLGSAYFTTKIEPILQQAGISINEAELQAGLTVWFGSLAGILHNALIHYLYKDEIAKENLVKEIVSDK